MIRRLLLSMALLAGFSFGMQALSTSYYASESKLASGKWVKIATRSEGIYQISYDQLRELGFSNPQKVQVFGYAATCSLLDNVFSEEIPDDVAPIATMHTVDGRILFFGASDEKAYGTRISTSQTSIKVTRTPYDTASYYFLSEVDEPEEIATRPYRSPTTAYKPFTSHIGLSIVDEDLQNPSNGGSLFLGRSMEPGVPLEYQFYTPDHDPESSISQKISLHYQAAFNVSSSVSGGLKFTYPDGYTAAETFCSTISPVSESTMKYNYPYGFLLIQRNEDTVVPDDFTYSLTFPGTSRPTVGAINYAAVIYPRKNLVSAEHPFIVMGLPYNGTAAGYRYTFRDVTDKQLEVWNIDNDYSFTRYPVSYDTSASTATITLDATTARLVAFNPSYTFPTPEVIGDLPSQNLHAMETPDMLIITTEEQRPAAEQLAALHRAYQGLDVAVVVHTDIYNEFSSGARSAMAYRRFAKMFYDRDPQKFKYLMFLGPVNYDNRCILSDQVDRLVCFSQDNDKLSNYEIYNYPIDAYFALLGDTYQHTWLTTALSQPAQILEAHSYSIAVGRVPSISLSQATAYVNKVERRFANGLTPQQYYTGVISGGSGDNCTHARYADDIYNAMDAANPAFISKKFYIEQYPESSNLLEKVLSEYLSAGVGYWLYTGHGSPTSINGWANSQVNVNQYDVHPIVMFASCDQYAYDHQNRGLIETMLFAENGGCIGGMAATRSVYIAYNQYSALPFSEAYATASAGATLGEIFKNAHNTKMKYFAAHTDDFNTMVLRNLYAYSLAGDPAIPVGAPQYTADIQTINGAVAVGAPKQVKAFEPIHITGCVRNADGTVNTGFNGQVSLTIYDGPLTFTTLNTTNEPTSTHKPLTASYREYIIGYQQVNVVNGVFEADVICSEPTQVSDYHRIFASAVADSGATAAGYSHSIVVNRLSDSEYTEVSSSAPAIRNAYISDLQLQPTEEISASGKIVATIDPSSLGLQYNRYGVTDVSKITLDDFTHYFDVNNYLTPLEDGTLRLEYPISSLSEGSHSAVITVVNKLGLTASATLDFEVVTRSLNPVLLVDETTARSAATIDIDNNEYDYCRLSINDHEGQTVYTVENPSFPYSWNLKDTQGAAVPDGRYSAIVTVRRGQYYGHSQDTPIVVLR